VVPSPYQVRAEPLLQQLVRYQAASLRAVTGPINHAKSGPSLHLSLLCRQPACLQGISHTYISGGIHYPARVPYFLHEMEMAQNTREFSTDKVNSASIESPTIGKTTAWMSAHYKSKTLLSASNNYCTLTGFRPSYTQDYQSCLSPSRLCVLSTTLCDLSNFRPFFFFCYVG
jgi:hypothetical protein